MLDENDSTTTTTSADETVSPAEADTAPDTAADTAPDTAADSPAPDSPAPDSPAPDSPAPDSPAPELLTDPGDVPPVRKTARKATRKVGTRTTRKVAAAPPDPLEETAEPAEPGAESSSAETDAGPVDDLVTGADQETDSLEPPVARRTARKIAQKAATKKATAKRSTTKKAAEKTTAKKTTKRASKKVAAATDDGADGLFDPDVEPEAGLDVGPEVGPEVEEDLDGQSDALTGPVPDDQPAAALVPEGEDRSAATPDAPRSPLAPTSLLFQAPDPVAAPKRTRRRVGSSPAPAAEAASTGPAVDSMHSAPDAGTATDETLPTHGRDSGSDTSTGPDTTIGPDTTTGPDGSPDTGTEVRLDTRPDTEADTEADTEVDAQAGTRTGTEGDEPDDTREDDEQGGNRRRRRRGGRRRRRGGGSDGDAEGANDTETTGSTGRAAGGDTDDDSPAGDDEAGQDAPSGGRQGGRSGQRSGQKGGRNAAKEPAAKEASQESGQGAERGSGPDDQDDSEGQDEGTGTRRRRRRRRTGEDGDGGADEPNTVVKVRKPRNAEDEITSLHGSTRLEAKKQRRREGREAGRRRAPIVSEAEFLARREAVDRVMVIRQREDLTQIAVLEDKVLVEHYVARESQTSLIGNVYLGRVQNVLPSMEAAFIDIGKGRNAVLYAGEVNWDSLGAGNGPRKIEQVLKSGQLILVQVSKDPIGHKGARLTSQISLPGRFLVYVPDGTTSGISRKLPDTERSRLKALLKEIVPDSAGVIVRTAAEGASEEELTLDVERLTARWADIESKVEKAREKGGGPQLLYGEPDLTLKVVRDLFTEDFAKLVISGDEAWDLVNSYVKHVAPDLEERLERYAGDEDVFSAYRIDEQIAKGLDRKVWLPSGGSLVIDRTEAMTVVDVNTGKFTGSGGNLEETVTKNNLEAAEEMVRQLRLRDIGGIIVVDFIDMVLESNRDLVLRRLVECLGRDRTRHQVAEVTSLGLVQMTRKRIGTGLVESFSENCEHCQGRGVVIHHEPVEPRRQPDDEPRRGRRGRGRGEGDDAGSGSGRGADRSPAPVVVKAAPSPKDIAAMAKHEPRPVPEVHEAPEVEEAREVPAVPGVPEVIGVTDLDLPAADVPLGAVPDALVPAEEPATPDQAAAEPAAPDQAPPEPLAPEADRAEVRPQDGPPADEPAAARPAPTVHADGLSPESSGDPVPVMDGVRDGVPVAPGEVDTPEEGVDREVAAGQPAPTMSDFAPPTADPVPAGPRLVTSTRRRVARRPAGPPSGAVAVVVTSEHDDAADDGSGTDGTGGGGDGTGLVDAGRPQVEQAHVPVKRKGRR